MIVDILLPNFQVGKQKISEAFASYATEVAPVFALRTGKFIMRRKMAFGEESKKCV
ncbi:MAG: hypothetical protein Q7J16_05405 [Candidatus Cloacimonadales bacterium]|nr:hypothetical protein [Candidatus Cloacimonadales bacterium]